MEKTMENIKLDHEWVALMKEAKTLGISVEEVRLFLAKAQNRT